MSRFALRASRSWRCVSPPPAASLLTSAAHMAQAASTRSFESVRGACPSRSERRRCSSALSIHQRSICPCLRERRMSAAPRAAETAATIPTMERTHPYSSIDQNSHALLASPAHSPTRRIHKKVPQSADGHVLQCLLEPTVFVPSSSLPARRGPAGGHAALPHGHVFGHGPRWAHVRHPFSPSRGARSRRGVRFWMRARCPLHPCRLRVTTPKTSPSRAVLASRVSLGGF